MALPHPLIEVHEDRISRLEENVTECRIGLEVLKTQVTDGVDMLAKKMDDVASVAGRVAAIEKHHEIEREVKQRTYDRRVKFIKIVAAAGSVGGASVGILMKLLGE